MILKDPTTVIANGAARNIDLLGVSVLDTRDRLTSPDSSFFAVWHKNKWVAGKSIPFRVIGLNVIGNPANHFILLGENGEIFIMGGGKDDIEQITRDIELPLTNIINSGSQIYVVGMGRQIYTRVKESTWIPIHNGVLSERSDKINGFQTIVKTDNHLYAGGWGGEIWFYNGTKWSQEVSPTNFILSDSTITNKGQIVFCGRNGTIVIGETGIWSIIDTGFISDDLWSTVYYDNKLFFSSGSHIYFLDDEQLVEVDFEIDGYNGTHYKLQVIENHLFSFGERDILVFDGKDWSRILTE